MNHINFIFAVIVMTIAAYIDQKERIVPNWLSFGSIGLGIALSALFPEIHNAPNWFMGALSATGDCAVIVILMCIYSEVIEKAFRLDYGIGGGDIKIMGALATIVNIKYVFVLFLIWPFIEMIHYAYLKFKNFDIYHQPACPGMLLAMMLSFKFANFV